MEGEPAQPKVIEVNLDPGQAERGGMLKEIHEQPTAIRETLIGRISDDKANVVLPELGMAPAEVKTLRKVSIVACGTVSNTGLAGWYLIEKLAGTPVEWDVAS